MGFKGQAHPEHASIEVTELDGDILIRLAGRLDLQGVELVWDPAIRAAKFGKPLRVDASDVVGLDGAGVALLSRLEAAPDHTGTHGLSPEFVGLLHGVVTSDLLLVEPAQAKAGNWVERVGAMAALTALSIRTQVTFVGACVSALAWALMHPRRVRWRDVLSTAESVGANGLPIISLIGFLMGLIMAFQSAVTLKRFGAEIFVADMLGAVMFRELGPLVTAILLAGRSGSAFAAEIGTMKVNDEVSALTTMGLDPLRFLVVPRVAATLLVMPFLVLFFDLLSLVGGAIVVLSMGFPLTTYTARVFSAVPMSDFFEGLAKAFVFAMLVAGVGCQRGLSTGTGASAVGQSTTSSVVGGLVLIAVADGLFATIAYYVGG